MLSARQPRDPAARERQFLQPDPRRAAQRELLVVSALVPYKRIDQAVAACTQSGRRLIVIGEGPERATAGSHGRSNGPVSWAGSPTRDWRSLSELPGLAIPGRRGFRDRADRGIGLWCTGDRAGRGGVAETVDNTVGRTYGEPTSAGLLAQSTPGKPTAARMTRARGDGGPRHFQAPSSAIVFSSSSPRSWPADAASSDAACTASSRAEPPDGEKIPATNRYNRF